MTLMLLASALTCLILALTIGRELGLFSDRFRFVREYSALLATIDELYIGEYDMLDVSVAAKRAAVLALRDRWSRYLTPAEFAEYLNRAGNVFPGIGINAGIDEDTGGMKVLYVFRGSGAYNAGLVIGDVITGIDENDITALEFIDMRALLARPLGDTVDLSVLRADGITRTITVEFSLVFSDPVSHEMLDGGIGYIALANFEAGSADGFIAAVDELIEQGARGFVFDVRGNNGGRVVELSRILDRLLPPGEIFIGVDASGEEAIIRSGPGTIDIPAVVIVDEHSFSAAEYFAAQLREFEYAYIIGEQTTGKSRSQITVPLPCGGALRISSARFLTKNRIDLYEVGGVTPDYLVSLTDEEFALFRAGELPKDIDPQFQQALAVLDTMLEKQG